MKWLLITINHGNPHLDFSIAGIRSVISVVDPNAKFLIYNGLQFAEACRPVEFDRYVLTGPIYQLLPNLARQSEAWWGTLIRGYPAKDQSKFLIWGAESIFPGDSCDWSQYEQLIDDTRMHAWKIITALPIFRNEEGFINSINPSVFNQINYIAKPEYNLCNIVSWSEYPNISKWESLIPKIVPQLLDRKFLYVAHSFYDVQYAQMLGWTEDNIRYFNTVDEYLDLYSRATCYFGNRLNGAAFCAGLKIPTWVINDSRIMAVTRLGGRGSYPFVTDINIDDVHQWLHNPTIDTSEFSIDTEFNRMTELLLEFTTSNLLITS